MEQNKTIDMLAALAQDTRLAVFRMLIRQGHEGLPASVIADRLEVRRNLMSTHLAILANAGLTRTRREGRKIYHAVDIDAVRGFLGFLVEDCCNGEPDKCANLIESITAAGNCGGDEAKTIQ